MTKYTENQDIKNISLIDNTNIKELILRFMGWNKGLIYKINDGHKDNIFINIKSNKVLIYYNKYDRHRILYLNELRIKKSIKNYSRGIKFKIKDHLFFDKCCIELYFEMYKRNELTKYHEVLMELLIKNSYKREKVLINSSQKEIMKGLSEIFINIITNIQF